MLQNGQRISGDKLADWHNKDALPRLDNQPLLDAGNPLKWLRDRAVPLAYAPDAFVETHTGDVLPGTVASARSGQELPFDPLPPHLIVEPAVILLPPGKPAATTIRVVTSALKRVVWQRQSRRFQESRVFLRDGRALAYRAIRFSDGAVMILTADGSQRLSWSELAEIHFPRAETWPAYFDELAGSCPSATSRLMQVETAGGLVATSSLDRFTQRFEGNPQDADRWIHGIQPAWSLDILWVPCREIAMRRLFGAHQVPLSRLAPSRALALSLLAGTGRPPQANRNVYSGPLQSAQHEFGWGVGVQARSELAYELPAGVKSLRGSVAIDRASGNGGCVRARVFVNEAKGQPLWESPVLVGSERVADLGTIALAGPAAQQKELVLQVDPGHDSRPAGADPFDIRDATNWLDPVLELDPAAVQIELDNRLAQRLPAWREAMVRPEAGAGDSSPQIAYFRNEHLPAPGHFQALAGHPTRGLVISRSFTLRPQDQWLVISAVRPPDKPKSPKLEVRIGNEPVAEYDPPAAASDPSDVRPLAIALAPYQLKEKTVIDVEVRQIPAENAAPLHWRTFQVAEQLPTLYRVLEDESPLAAVRAALTQDERHYGTASLRVARGTRIELPLPSVVAIRERPQWGQYRFLRLAVRKKGNGQVALELGSEPARIEPARYDAGKGEPALPKSHRIWNEDLPDQWVVLTRDLFADFGNIDLTRLALHCTSGDAACFDHIYLARSQEDFKLIPAAPSAEQTNQKAREELAKAVVERVRPAVVTVQLAGGAVAGGIVISPQGELLTAGHFLRASNQEVTVHLADGKTAKAKSQGISRELDLGLVKITDEGQWPAANISGRNEVDPGANYVGLIFSGQIGPHSAPQTHVASLRRFFRTMLWTDIEAAQYSSGGALFNPQGEAVGLHIRRSQYGGFLFTRLHAGELAPHLTRMRNGEIFGAWPAGCEPVLGIEGRPTLAGLEVTAASGPARSLVQRGDVIVRIAGQPVVGDEDLYQALRELDAGQQVALELLRGGAAATATITLAPRVP